MIDCLRLSHEWLACPSALAKTILSRQERNRGRDFSYIDYNLLLFTGWVTFWHPHGSIWLTNSIHFPRQKHPYQQLIPLGQAEARPCQGAAEHNSWRYAQQQLCIASTHLVPLMVKLVYSKRKTEPAKMHWKLLTGKVSSSKYNLNIKYNLVWPEKDLLQKNIFCFTEARDSALNVFIPFSLHFCSCFQLSLFQAVTSHKWFKHAFGDLLEQSWYSPAPQ